MENKKQLSLFDLSMIVVSLVIGMGIFRNPASVAATSGDSTIFLRRMGCWRYHRALRRLNLCRNRPAICQLWVDIIRFLHIAIIPPVGFSVNAIILISNAASLAVVALNRF
jgi:APA family basic amino acid/polyamine antiporter